MSNEKEKGREDFRRSHGHTDQKKQQQQSLVFLSTKFKCLHGKEKKSYSEK